MPTCARRPSGSTNRGTRIAQVFRTVNDGTPRKNDPAPGGRYFVHRHSAGRYRNGKFDIRTNSVKTSVEVKFVADASAEGLHRVVGLGARPAMRSAGFSGARNTKACLERV